MEEEIKTEAINPSEGEFNWLNITASDLSQNT